MVEESLTKTKTLRYRIKLLSKRNDRWLNSHMQSVMEVWGANMDFQLILDPGMVVDYMTKYVTKADSSHGPQVARALKAIFTKTVREEGRTTQTFIRRVMGKLLEDRMISKQEKCHLLLGLPIVRCSHTVVKVDLRNKFKFVDTTNQETGEHTEAPDTARRLVLRKSIIDVYGERLNADIWNTFTLPGNVDMPNMNLAEFCTRYSVGTRLENRNKICIRQKTVVASFFPTFSSNVEGPNYTAYCKYALMKHQPWEGLVESAWGGK